MKLSNFKLMLQDLNLWVPTPKTRHTRYYGNLNINRKKVILFNVELYANEDWKEELDKCV